MTAAKGSEEIAKQARNFIKFGMDDDEIYRMRDCLENFVREALDEAARGKEELQAALKTAHEIFGSESDKLGSVIVNLEEQVSALKSSPEKAERVVELLKEVRFLGACDADLANRIDNALEMA